MASDIRTDHGVGRSRIDPLRPVKIPRKVDVEVGFRIRERRKFFGMSQTDLGKALDLTFQQIQKYEKGTNRVGASRLAEIAAVLQVPISYFFGENTEGGNGITHDNEITAFLEHGDGKSLFEAFTRIKTKSTRKQIVRLVEHLAPR